MNLEKNLRFRDRYRLQLRAEAFNTFNHPNFAHAKLDDHQHCNRWHNHGH